MCTCTCAYVLLRTYASLSSLLFLISFSTHIRARMFLRVCAYACMRACVYVYVYVCVYARACLCLRLRAYPYRLVTPLVSSLANRPRLPRSLAHSYFQFASESKGLIKSPQTGFSGISRVNAKEIQPPARPECLYCRPIAYRSTTTTVPSPSSPKTPLAYISRISRGPADARSPPPRFTSPRVFPQNASFWGPAAVWHERSLIIRRSNVISV